MATDGTVQWALERERSHQAEDKVEFRREGSGCGGRSALTLGPLPTVPYGESGADGGNRARSSAVGVTCSERGWAGA